jgi:adenosylmethionine-8-amino-7-oxononanoate aminotransferase
LSRIADRRERIVELDKRRVWHPYTAMDRYRAEVDPIVVARAEGPYLWDEDGSRYIDANSSWWVAALGHNHPRLVEALVRQARLNSHSALAGMTHAGAAELAEALCARAADGLEHVFYSDDGSTAVEVALKLALQFWAQSGRPERRRFLALEDAFHGETRGATAIGGVGVFRAPFAGAVPEQIFVPSPAADLAAALAALEEAVETHSAELAALVVEPMVQGAAGMRIYDPVFLSVARELCDRHEVLLVADEVFSGYGRTGPMWACEHAGITPDILCTAKGFSGGVLPMAATLTTERIQSAFAGSDERAFYYGHSFCGNPLGCAVALEVLEVYDDERILEELRPKAERIRKGFAELAGLPGVGGARSLGMIGAVDLVGDRSYLSRGGWAVYAAARERGAYLRPMGNVVYVTPPLNIPDAVLDELLGIVRASIVAATGEGET